MPWCRGCDRFLNPSSVMPDGTCPSCGRQLDETGAAHEELKAPWHFKLLVAAVVVYLGWRLLQLVGLLAS